MVSAAGIATKQILDPGAVCAGRATEDAIEARRAVTAPRRGQRIFIIGLLARRDRLHGGVKQSDLGGEKIAEQA